MSKGCPDIPREALNPSKDGRNGLDTKANSVLLQQQGLWELDQPIQHLMLAEGQGKNGKTYRGWWNKPNNTPYMFSSASRAGGSLSAMGQAAGGKRTYDKRPFDQDEGRENRESNEY